MNEKAFHIVGEKSLVGIVSEAEGENGPAKAAVSHLSADLGGGVPVRELLYNRVTLCFLCPRRG